MGAHDSIGERLRSLSPALNRNCWIRWLAHIWFWFVGLSDIWNPDFPRYAHARTVSRANFDGLVQQLGLNSERFSGVWVSFHRSTWQNLTLTVPDRFRGCCLDHIRQSEHGILRRGQLQICESFTIGSRNGWDSPEFLTTVAKGHNWVSATQHPLYWEDAKTFFWTSGLTARRFSVVGCLWTRFQFSVYPRSFRL